MTRAEFEKKEMAKPEEKAKSEEGAKPEEKAELSALEASLERWKKLQELAEQDSRGKERGESFRLDDAYKVDILNAVNAAIHLRRPLLVTGKPGSGKTSLAYAVALELRLGPVLSWPITARSVLQDALFRYDAVARLQDVNLKVPDREMGEYIRLGPVGTAFLPSHLPRVLLIDEIDKCDINLPNDLLNLFEEGWYEIPELVRCKKEMAEVTVRTADTDDFARIKGGRVQCYEFPFVVMTSNGEREFPPAFLRRCLRLRMSDPGQNPSALERIVTAHLQKGENKRQWTRIQREITEIVREFVDRGKEETEDIATDQLLNVVYLLTREVKPEGDAEEIEKLKDLLLKKLSED
jgi:MoxR-like ATPase